MCALDISELVSNQVSGSQGPAGVPGLPVSIKEIMFNLLHVFIVIHSVIYQLLQVNLYRLPF